jgi:hypothetical protein
MSSTVAETRFLHVANGSATTDLIARAGIPGETSIWADPLHEGPVPGNLDDDELRSVRARHISTMVGDVRWQDVHADLLSWEAALPRSAACDEVVLWFEHDLFDQLNLIHVLDRLGSTTARAPLVSLICINRFPGYPLFKGLGELRPDDLASLLERRQRVGAPQYDLARRAWYAFRSSTPAAIETLLHDDLAALSFLAAALRRHLEEFPAATDGLSRTERRVLELASKGPIDVWQVFSQMHNGETAFYIADSSFLNLVRELAGLSPPLLAIDGAVVQAAPDGLAVLNGMADRVALCGIDRWLGGVHLEGRGRVWRWDPNAGRVGVA